MTEMDFIASLIPIAISTGFSMRTAQLFLEPTSYVSFFGLFWFPYRDDLPYRVLSDGLVVGFINAVFVIAGSSLSTPTKVLQSGRVSEAPI